MSTKTAMTSRADKIPKHRKIEQIAPLWRAVSFPIASIALVVSAWLLFFLATPPFQTPDENGHYAYVQALANGVYPILGHETSPQNEALAESYYFSETIFNQQKIFNRPPKAIDPDKSDYTETSIQAYHPPIYFLTAAVFYRFARTIEDSPAVIYYFTKFASFSFYLLFVGVTWRFFRSVLPTRQADFVTLSVALQPTLLMMAAAVNPEIAAIALFTVVFVSLFRVIEGGHISPKYGILLGLLTGLAILTKFTNIILVPLVIIGLIFCLSYSWQKKLRQLLFFSLAASSLLTPWLIFNQVRYGSFLPHNLDTSSLPDVDLTASYLIMHTLFDIKESLLSLLGIFGWLDTPILFEIRFIYVILLITGLGGSIRFFLNERRSQDRMISLILISITAVALVTAFMVSYALYLKIKFHYAGGTIQARYFLVALLPASILFYKGIGQVFRIDMESDAMAKTIFYFSVLFLLIGVLFSLLPRFYV